MWPTCVRMRACRMRDVGVFLRHRSAVGTPRCRCSTSKFDTPVFTVYLHCRSQTTCKSSKVIRSSPYNLSSQVEATGRLQTPGVVPRVLASTRELIQSANSPVDSRHLGSSREFSRRNESSSYGPRGGIIFVTDGVPYWCA